MKRTFTNLLLFYILGIVIYYFVNIPLNIVVFMFLFSMLCLSYSIIKTTLNQRLLLFFFFILGISISFLNGNGNLEKFIEEEIYIEARVEDLEKKTSELEKYIIRIESVDGRKIPIEKALLTIIGEKDLKLGSKIDLKVTPKLPKENRNPGLFNYKQYLKGKKIYTLMTVDDYNLKSIDNSDIPFRYRLKEKSIETIDGLFKSYLNEENNSLITSIILGESDYLDEENVKLYRDMGLSHILAVSGLHIGIISSFLMFVISRLGIKRKSNTLITLIFIWSYGYIIGYPDSILRASLLFSFLYLSKIIHKPFDSLNILSLAALILLVINPNSLFSVGFQLSFIASASIVVFTERIAHLLYPLEGKFIDTVSSLLAVNIGVSPLQAYYFNRINLMGFLSNILIVPILSFSLIVAFIMIGLEFVLPSLNSIFGTVLNSSLNLQFLILRFIGRSPINLIRIFSPDIITIIYIFIFTFIILDIIDLKVFNKRIQKTMVVYLSFLILINIINIKENMEIHFIDVGQGDSIYIRSGKKDILIDTGGSMFTNYNIPEKTVLPYLEKIGVRKLDAIFISHFHEDHCQGLPLLLDSFRVDHIFISHLPTEPYLDLLTDDRLIFLRKGDNIEIGKSINFEVIWPIDEMKYEDNLNNKSMVGVLNYRDVKILFTGDMEREVEASLMDEMEKVDILKVGHHGSNTSSTEKFIEKIDPEVGVISLGEKNMYNHPSKEVLETFKDRTKIYRTDKDGLVKITITDGYQVSPYLVDGERVKADLEDYLIYNHNYFLYNILFFLIIYFIIRKTNWEESINEL